MGATRNLLVVDDDPFALESLAPALTRAGYDVDVANGGEDALRRAERRVYAVAVIDVLMRPMDGPTLAVRLKEALPGVRILFMTGRPTMEGAVDALLDLHHGVGHPGEVPVRVDPEPQLPPELDPLLLRPEETEIRRYETNLGNWVADQARQLFPEANMALINAGSLRLNQDIPAGPIRVRSLEELFAFPN